MVKVLGQSIAGRRRRPLQFPTLAKRFDGPGNKGLTRNIREYDRGSAHAGMTYRQHSARIGKVRIQGADHTTRLHLHLVRTGDLRVCAVHAVRYDLLASRFLLYECTAATDTFSQPIQHRNSLFPGDTRI